LIDDNRVIKEKNCQYYLEFEESDYKQDESYKPYFIPKGMKLYSTSGGIDNDTDTTVSTWYRGLRYGFAPQSEYISKFNRYVQKFKHAISGEDYYGYVHTEYHSPELTENLLTNCNFEGTSGWGCEGGVISAEYGYFDFDNETKDTKFIDAL
jgi:hypothetical protein